MLFRHMVQQLLNIEDFCQIIIFKKNLKLKFKISGPSF